MEQVADVLGRAEQAPEPPPEHPPRTRRNYPDDVTRVDLGAAGTAWYERAFDSLPRVAEILTALLGAIALAGIVRGIYRRTLGRRSDRYARLRRLGTNAQLSFFSSVLGEPPAMERTLIREVTSYDEQGEPMKTPAEFKESIWIDRDFYVHALADADATVQAYSVTTRSKRFHPRFQIPGGTADDPSWFDRLRGREFHFKPNPAVKLGKTRFAALGRPGQAAAWIGAHNWHYFEPYYFGNPGYYQNFVFSINDAGVGVAPFSPEWLSGFSWGFGEEPLDPKLALVSAAIEADDAGREGGDSLQDDPDKSVEEAKPEEELDLEVEEDPPLPPALEAFRRSAQINTYTVIGPDLSLDDYPLAEGDRLDQYPVIFGVSTYRVRTLGGE
jgi:hypothetical protein